MDYKKNLPYIIIIVVVIGLCVWAGFSFLKPKSNSANNLNSPEDSGGPNGQNGGGQWGSRGGAGRGNFKPLHGTIASLDSSSGTIVMTADDKSTKNITTTSTTRISEMDNGQRTTLAFSDLTVGEEINVMASDTTASTIPARMIIVGTFTPPQGGGYNRSSGGDSSGGDPGNNSDSSSISGQI